MGISDELTNIIGVVTVEIEGFFTERFINLCKINNIKIWDIRTIVKGVVRFKINIKQFKKLRKIARKTKCKVRIKDKKGLYFKLFRYRKRKFAIILLFLVIALSILFSTFIWKIEVTGNCYLTEEQIIDSLKKSGVYVGKNKIGIDKREIINNLRVNLSDISWAGIDISGSTLRLEVVEKTKIADDQIQNEKIGDIIANKSGLITKIVPENGTAKLKIGSYVEQGMVLIEGVMYSKVLEPENVSAKGIVIVENDSIYEKEYKYVNQVKEYTNKNKYTIGITINSKENMLNYLNKNKKYDISKSSKTFNLFSNTISLDFYKCSEYIEKEYSVSEDEILNIARSEWEKYLTDDVLKNAIEGKLIKSNEIISRTSDSIIYKVEYTISERIGEFRERTKNEQYTY